MYRLRCPLQSNSHISTVTRYRAVKQIQKDINTNIKSSTVN